MIRIYTRIVLVKKFGMEDGFLLGSTVIYFVFIGFFFSSSPYGLGKHTWDITTSDLLKVIHRQYPSQILYSLFVSPTKIAIIVQIMCIFDSKHGHKQDFVYWGSWIMIMYTTAYSLALLFICIFPCTPIRRAWEPTLPGTCVTPMLPSVVSAVGNLTSDILVLSLPIIGVRRLQMPTKKKIAVLAVFATGLLACIVSTVRLYFIVQVDKMKNDYMQWVTMEALLAIIENSAITLCCCFPLFPMFWKHISKRQIQGWNRSATTDSYQLSRRQAKNSNIGKNSGTAKYWDMGTRDGSTLTKGESQEHITTTIPE